MLSCVLVSFLILQDFIIICYCYFSQCWFRCTNIFTTFFPHHPFFYSTLPPGITFLPSECIFLKFLQWKSALCALSLFIYLNVFILPLFLGRFLLSGDFQVDTVFCQHIEDTMPLLASCVNVEKSVIDLLCHSYSLWLLFYFAFIFDILQFHYDVPKYRFLLSFLGFIEIPESVDWCLS